MQTAEGALTETHSILQRMRDLAVQAANDGRNRHGRHSATIKTEFDAARRGADRIADTDATSTAQKLLDGSATPARFQVGSPRRQTLAINHRRSTWRWTVTGRGYRHRQRSPATGGQTPQCDDRQRPSIDDAIKTVSTARANLGAVQNRFEHTINNLNVAVENLSASESRIRDTDMAAEMMNFTRAQILSQAGTAMLAQANQAPQGVLRLLQ